MVESVPYTQVTLDEELIDIQSQLAENEEVDSEEGEELLPSSEEKRELLEKTKIVKQTWSILEIYQKVQDKKLILDPNYQRNVIWSDDKKTAFIESLYMGILIPPIYVVEIPSVKVLEGVTYEVVDGKQRLSTILAFLNNKLTLKTKALEYFKDWFSNKQFTELLTEHEEKTKAMLSCVLDIYVITANSPEFTKYDIFSRLNKGSEPLKVNEIRKAIYQSQAMKLIDSYVHEKLEDKSSEYKTVFSDNMIKRYNDFGRFFRSIAFYLCFDETTDLVRNYNSRPREMINSVLSSLQTTPSLLSNEELKKILDSTLRLSIEFDSEIGALYLIDTCVYFDVKYPEEFKKIEKTIAKDDQVLATLQRSASTTSFVNERFKRIHELIKGVSYA